MTGNFLFSSVGDNSNLDQIITGDVNYDVYIIYYGKSEETFEKYQKLAKYAEKRKGSKFQNFKYFYDTYPEIISKYDRFFVMDDDCIIDVKGVNTMFDLSRKYNLKICSPSLLSGSKISHLITCQKNNRILTYTNFVEVSFPMFSYDALEKFMPQLSYELIGWGIDFLYVWCNGLDEKKSYAIIHSVGCINPRENSKKCNKRELSLIENWTMRDKIWREYAAKIGCPTVYKLVEYDTIQN
jgi:hypothetical protein